MPALVGMRRSVGRHRSWPRLLAQRAVWLAVRTPPLGPAASGTLWGIQDPWASAAGLRSAMAAEDRCGVRRQHPDLPKPGRWVGLCGDRCLVLGHGPGLLSSIPLPHGVTFSLPVSRCNIVDQHPWNDFIRPHRSAGVPAVVASRRPDPGTAWFATGRYLLHLSRDMGPDGRPSKPCTADGPMQTPRRWPSHLPCRKTVRDPAARSGNALSTLRRGKPYGGLGLR